MLKSSKEAVVQLFESAELEKIVKDFTRSARTP